MFKKLQKTFVTLLVLLVSGMIPTLSAIAAELEAVPEFKGESGGVIEVVQGSSVDYDLKLSYTGGNKNNTSGTFTVYTNYQILGATPDKSDSPTTVSFSGETFSNTLKGKINAKNAVPGTYTVPVNVTITNTGNGNGNTVINAVSDNLTVKVLPNDTTPPTVTVTNPVNGGFYQSGQLPNEPQFTVNEDYQVPATFTGWSKVEGTYKLVVSVKDLAGNVGTSSEITYTVDDTPPVITADIVNGGVYNAETLKDKIKSYYSVNEATTTLTADELDLTVGQHTVYITAIDRAGNKTEKDITYIIDNDAPSISFEFEDGGYYKSSAFSDFNPYYKIEDDNLDEDSIKASQPNLSEGTHSVTVSALDLAQNYNNANATYTIDDTAPTVTIHLENRKYYNTSSLNEVEEFYSVSDKNPVKTEANGFGTTDGHYQAIVKATDAAGNSTTKNVEYYVDTIAPVITIDSEKLASGGFYQSSYLESLADFYSVKDTNKDNVEVSPFILTEGSHTLTITATDKAGNSTTEEITYTVDNSAPTISFILKGNGYHQSANLPIEYYTASDKNGVVSVVADALNTTEGTHTLNVTARDAAGNSTTESITYTVDDTNPVVSISLPEGGGYYQSSALPDQPEFTVNDSSPVTTNIVGYNKEAETSHMVTVTATDAAGNTSSSSVTYTVDNTTPEITSKLVDGGYYNKETLENISQYYEVHDANLDSKTGVTASDLVLTEGNHEAVITAVDKAGNKNKLTIHYTVDNTKPTITFNFNDGGFYQSNKLKAIDPLYNVEDENLDEDSIQSSEISYAEGEHTLTVSAADLAKNSNSASASYIIDDTAPKVSLTLEERKYYNLASLEALGQYWSVTDNSPFEVEATPLATEDGIHTVTVKAIDRAGNETTVSVEYQIDNTPPEIKMDETKLKDGGIYNAKYLNALSDKPYTVVDKNPGTDSASTFNLEEGTHGYTITAIDLAGNTTTKTISYTVDNTPPTILFNIEDNKVYTSEALAKIGQLYSINDNRPIGEVNVTVNKEETSTEGTYTLTVIATDKANNSTTESITYTVDDIAPEVIFHLINGKYYTTKSLTEALVGFDHYYSVTDLHLTDQITADELKTNEGNHTLTVTAKDAAGNIGTNSIAYTVDNTAPVISGLEGLTLGQRFLVGQDVTVTPAVTDNYDTRPVTSGSDKLDTSKAGAHTITVTATDQAGNTSSFTYSYYVYNYSGILQPIKADGSSTFKKNSTIPVKFQIADGSNYVKDAKATLTLVKVNNDGSEADAAVISTSAATEGNLFRYDLSDNQYIFNLGTKTLEEGKYKLVITIELDGANIPKESQTFTIKK